MPQQIRHSEFAIVDGYLRVKQDLQEQIAHFLIQRPRIAGVQRFQRLMSFFDQEGAQRLVRLFTVPRAAFRRAQMGDDILKRFEAAQRIHRRDEERSHDINTLTTVDLVEFQRFDRSVAGAGRVDQLDLKVIIVLVHQGQLEVGSD